MTDIQIYGKIRPFILRRLLYAALGFFVMLCILMLISRYGCLYPEYRSEIIVLFSGLGVFIGWKIIRHGESRYRMAQIAVITDLTTGKPYAKGDRGKAARRVRTVFRYAGFGSLLKNILQQKTFRNVRQYLSVTLANMIPYMGTCTLAWFFAHEDETFRQGTFHAVSAYYRNRRTLRPLILKAFLKEVLFVTLLFVIFLVLEAGVCFAAMENIRNLDLILEQFSDFSDTLEIVWEMYFEASYGYHWALRDVLVVIALYLAWFIKVFSIRAYQSVSIIRAYLKAAEENPPEDLPDRKSAPKEQSLRQ